MNKSLLVVLALGTTMLASCSSHPSDFRPAYKVSSDSVPPGTRDTDYSNFGGGEHTSTGEGHENHGREDVMLDHDAATNKIGRETEQVAPRSKTNVADSIESHE